MGNGTVATDEAALAGGLSYTPRVPKKRTGAILLMVALAIVTGLIGMHEGWQFAWCVSAGACALVFCGRGLP